MHELQFHHPNNVLIVIIWSSPPELNVTYHKQSQITTLYCSVAAYIACSLGLYYYKVYAETTLEYVNKVDVKLDYTPFPLSLSRSLCVCVSLSLSLPLTLSPLSLFLDLCVSLSPPPASYSLTRFIVDVILAYEEDGQIMISDLQDRIQLSDTTYMGKKQHSSCCGLSINDGANTTSR